MVLNNSATFPASAFYFEKTVICPVVNNFTIESDPILIPSCAFVRHISVPLARKKQKHATLADLMYSGRAGSKSSFPLCYI